MPPIPPHERPGHLLPHLRPGHRPPKPPHAQGALGLQGKAKKIVLAAVVATAVSAVSWYLMDLAGVGLAVILPVVAPVWIGITTILYMVLGER